LSDTRSMTGQDPASKTQWLKQAAQRHGFMGAGIARARRLDAEAEQLEAWLSKGYHGEMNYMANHFDMRVDPTVLVPGAKSVISLIYNYYPKEDAQVGVQHFEPVPEHPPLKIARYAYGEDYHKVVRRKLKALVCEMKEQFGDFHARVFVDSGPVMERDWAKHSGLGWIGKNTLLIDPKKGSYFFLAEIISDLEFEYDHPIRDHCGTCTRCIDACPTDAISPAGYVLDGSKCISYLTIELKNEIPDEFKGKMEGWIFGCDICQEVCPWNRFSKPHEEPLFEMSEAVKQVSASDWTEITQEIFNELFAGSPVKRTGLTGLLRNIRFVGNFQQD
jgi:epoxyqueuosine reductase